MENKTSLFKKADIYVSLAMFAFSGIILFQVFNTKIEESRLMPIMIFVLAFASALALLVQTVRGKDNVAEIGELKFSKKELIVTVILFGCYYLIKVLGFYSSVFLLTLGVSLVLWELKKPINVLWLLIYNIVLIVLLYVVFGNLFGMVMPSGIFI